MRYLNKATRPLQARETSIFHQKGLREIYLVLVKAEIQLSQTSRKKSLKISISPMKARRVNLIDPRN